MKINYSVSSPTPNPKVWRNSFLKKSLHGGKNFLGEIYGGMFYMGINNRLITQGGEKVFRIMEGFILEVIG